MVCSSYVNAAPASGDNGSHGRAYRIPVLAHLADSSVIHGPEPFRAAGDAARALSTRDGGTSSARATHDEPARSFHVTRTPTRSPRSSSGPGRKAKCSPFSSTHGRTYSSLSH